MGADYYARVIVGVSADKLITKTCVVDKVKKYHEDTGEPYTKETTRVRTSFLGVMVQDKELHVSSFVEENEDMFDGMKAFDIHHDCYMNQMVVGYQAAIVGFEDPTSMLVDLTSLLEGKVGGFANLKSRVQAVLKDCGFDIEPRVYLQAAVSA